MELLLRTITGVLGASLLLYSIIQLITTKSMDLVLITVLMGLFGALLLGDAIKG